MNVSDPEHLAILGIVGDVDLFQQQEKGVCLLGR